MKRWRLGFFERDERIIKRAKNTSNLGEVSSGISIAIAFGDRNGLLVQFVGHDQRVVFGRKSNKEIFGDI